MTRAAQVAAANTEAARLLVTIFASLGVTDACVTPGSRSTPLTAALAETGAVRPWLHLDERSASFFALGLARQAERPVLLVCTSGTAAANYLPAIVEANLSRIPLILCTADRPPYLRDVGAPQTIDQVGLYGSHVRWAMELPCPSGLPAEARALRTAAERALRASMGPLPGPVHLNVPFDEPLIASPGEHPPAPAPSPPGSAPGAVTVSPDATAVAKAAAVLNAAGRPLIIAGPETGGLPAAGIAALAERLDAPVLADPLGGLRTGPHDLSHIVSAYDAVLRDPRAPELAPDVVLRFGAAPTSKTLNQFLASPRIDHRILVDLPGGWRDPSMTSDIFLAGDPASAAAALFAQITPCDRGRAWAGTWLARDLAARDALAAASLGFAEPFEGRIFAELQATLPAGSTIVAGNSMPVRDMDTFVVPSARQQQFVSNRGANGIDGVTSTALGAAAGSDEPVVLVLGDISFLHDLSGLWAAKRHGLNLTIVLVNNDGSGIFHYLPQAQHPSFFEEWFATPPGLDFQHAALLFDAEYVCPDGWETFRDAITRPMDGLRIIEVRTNREENTRMHREAWARAAEAAWAVDVLS